MDVAVMNPAQGHRELVAHLQSHRPRLDESEVVGVGGASAADQTRLRRHEFEMGFIAQPSWLAESELAFVDFGGSCVGLLSCRS
jgi:glycerol dehydrogenase-like iron-containing ADH family enzyme